MLKEMVHTEVVRAIRTVHSGKRLMPPEVAERLSEYFPQVALTPREVEVLGFVARGLANKEIAAQAGHRQRDHQDARAEYPRKTGRLGPHARGDARHRARHPAPGRLKAALESDPDAQRDFCLPQQAARSC